MNTLNFGKLTILSTGDIYANLNDKLLGNIVKNNIYEIVYKEIKSGNTWFKSKANVSPCQDCIYDFLCTPISNYEYALLVINMVGVNCLFKKSGSGKRMIVDVENYPAGLYLIWVRTTNSTFTGKFCKK